MENMSFPVTDVIKYGVLLVSSALVVGANIQTFRYITEKVKRQDEELEKRRLIDEEHNIEIGRIKTCLEFIREDISAMKNKKNQRAVKK